MRTFVCDTCGKPTVATANGDFLRYKKHDFCGQPCLVEWAVTEHRKYMGDTPNPRTGNRIPAVEKVPR